MFRPTLRKEIDIMFLSKKKGATVYIIIFSEIIFVTYFTSDGCLRTCITTQMLSLLSFLVFYCLFNSWKTRYIYMPRFRVLSLKYNVGWWFVTLSSRQPPFYSYKPSILFVGHMQAVQIQIRRSRTRRLIRVSTVCL